MKRAGTMLALSLAIAMVVVACASMQGSGRDHVTRAVSAQGGTDALAKVKTISQKGTVRQWEPEQSAAAGGEMRFANQGTMESVTDVTMRATRTDWVRDFQYPAPRKFTFSEVVTAEAGYVAGIDSNGRTKQSQESNPPAHTMSGLRLAASQRELARNSPLLALEMAQNPDRVSAAPDVTVAGVTYKAAAYRVGAETLTVMFDPSTGLPARIRSLDYDNIWGDVTYDLVLSDWQVVEGVRVATTRKYELKLSAQELRDLADVSYRIGDIGVRGTAIVRPQHRKGLIRRRRHREVSVGHTAVMVRWQDEVLTARPLVDTRDPDVFDRCLPAVVD